MGTGTATETIVELRSRAAGALVWLEVEYPGLQPPTALFATLDRLGWRTPSPAPPPKEAIDWSVPDEDAGTRYTVRPWTVREAVAEAPAGTGPGGRWSATERDRHLALLAGALVASAVTVHDPDGLLPAEVVRHEPGPGGETPPTDGPTYLDAATDNVRTLDRGWVRIEVLVPERAAAELHRIVDRHPVLITPIERRVSERFRGSSYERIVVDLRAHTVVASSDGPVLTDALRLAGLHPEVVQVGHDEHEAHVAAVASSLAPDEPHHRAENEAAVHPSVLTLVLDPACVPLVEAEARRLGLRDWQLAPTTRTVVERFRGSSYEASRPAVRFTLPLPLEPEDPWSRSIADALAAEGRVDPTDVERVLLVRPARPPESEARTAQAS